MTGIWVWNMLEKSPSIGIVQFGQLVGELPVKIKAYLAFDKSGELKVATDGQTDKRTDGQTDRHFFIADS